MTETALTPIKLKAQFPIPAWGVWAMWSDAERLATWLAGRANVQPYAGGAYELFWDEEPEHNSTLGCKVLAWEPPTRLAISWRGPEEWETLMPAGSTEVEIRIRDEGTGSVLYLTHSGWGEGGDWPAAREWQVEAWRHALGGLKALMAMAENLRQ